MCNTKRNVDSGLWEIMMHQRRLTTVTNVLPVVENVDNGDGCAFVGVGHT